MINDCNFPSSARFSSFVYGPRVKATILLLSKSGNARLSFQIWKKPIFIEPKNFRSDDSILLHVPKAFWSHFPHF